MILRIDRWQTELPPPADPDPDGASVVQELLGGKFGEMSTLMNYTFQSFNFRNRQGARPFYDLIANIAAEEYGHIELVAAAINTMLTGSDTKGARPRNSQQFIAGGKSALPQDSMGKPWSGDYVTATGDLVEDLTHNFFLETGARNNKLKVYEMVEHPAARALTGYLLVRGGVHQVAYARALELLTGADLTKLFPTPRIPTEKIPESKKHIDKGLHKILYRFSPQDPLPVLAQRLPGADSGVQGPAPRDGRGAAGRTGTARGRPGIRPAAPAGRVRARLRPRRDRRDRPATAHGRGPTRRTARRGRQRRRRSGGQGQRQTRLALPHPLRIGCGIATAGPGSAETEHVHSDGGAGGGGDRGQASVRRRFARRSATGSRATGSQRPHISMVDAAIRSSCAGANAGTASPGSAYPRGARV